MPSEVAACSNVDVGGVGGGGACVVFESVSLVVSMLGSISWLCSSEKSFVIMLTRERSVKSSGSLAVAAVLRCGARWSFGA